MKEIPLTQGKVALVDDADFHELSKHKWYARFKTTAWYAHRNKAVDGKKTVVSMHRELLGSECIAKVVDHADHNGLNNQRSNLRVCTQQDNLRNARKQTKQKSSKYKGVSWNKRRKYWTTFIGLPNKQVWLGSYSTEEDAARAYDAAAIEHFGAFAHLNLPDAPKPTTPHLSEISRLDE